MRTIINEMTINISNNEVIFMSKERNKAKSVESIKTAKDV